jgi:hypothetical protein
MKQVVAEQLKKSGPVFGTIGAVGGFVADILQPLAPFSSYLFFAAAFSAVTILVVMIVMSSLRTKVAPAFMLSLSIMLCSGVMFSLQGGEEEHSGVLASVIPGIESIQSSLGLIQEDVASIKRSTEKIEETTTRTEEIVTQVEKNTKATTEATKQVADAVKSSAKQIVGSLAEIQKGFSTLAQSGGIIVAPKRPEQFYHNARVQELGGDYGGARRSYNRYFSFKLNFLDPHLRYQTFLKVQEGRAGAREIYSAMYENDPRPIMEFARIYLLERLERIQMLESFVSKHADFAMAYLELSKEFSVIKTGKSTIKDLKKEHGYLKKFVQIDRLGQVQKMFLDKEKYSNIIAAAVSRLSILEGMAYQLQNPVSVSIFPEVKRHSEHKVVEYSKDLRVAPDKVEEVITYETVWKISVQIHEQSKSQKAILLNGKLAKGLVPDSQTSSGDASMFNVFISDGDLKPESHLAVSYLDGSNNNVGPFKLLLSKENYFLSFLEKISSKGFDLGLPIYDFEQVPGFPFVHMKAMRYGGTFLHVAAINNFTRVAKELIRRKVNPDIRNVKQPFIKRGNNTRFEGKRTPLYLAVRGGNVEVAKLLIDSGADINYGYLLQHSLNDRDQIMTALLIEAGLKNCGFHRDTKIDRCAKYDEGLLLGGEMLNTKMHELGEWYVTLGANLYERGGAAKSVGVYGKSAPESPYVKKVSEIFALKMLDPITWADLIDKADNKIDVYSNKRAWRNSTGLKYFTFLPREVAFKIIDSSLFGGIFGGDKFEPEKHLKSFFYLQMSSERAFEVH